jgi:dTMP kinase
MVMERGFFVTVEGGEGSGKTTLCEGLYTKLTAAGFDVMITREPGGVDVSEHIRQVIMDYNITSKTEALLFAAARVEHLEKKVKPALANKMIVISDRYIDSSVVYQGYARDLGVDVVRDLNMWATSDFLPDLTLYLKLDPVVGIARIKDNNRDTNRFDDEAFSFHEKLSNGYDRVLLNQSSVVTLDASVLPDVIIDEAFNQIMELING